MIENELEIVITPWFALVFWQSPPDVTQGLFSAVPRTLNILSMFILHFFHKVHSHRYTLLAWECEIVTMTVVYTLINAMLFI